MKFSCRWPLRRIARRALEVHRATITVMPAGSRAFVTWDVETDDAMVEVMQGAYTGALAALKEQLEG